MVGLLFRAYLSDRSVLRAASLGLGMALFLVWTEFQTDLPIPPTVLLIGALGSFLGLITVRLAMQAWLGRTAL